MTRLDVKRQSTKPQRSLLLVSSNTYHKFYDSNNSKDSNNSNDTKIKNDNRYTKNVAHFGDSRMPEEAISGQNLELSTVERGKGSSFCLSLRLS